MSITDGHRMGNLESNKEFLISFHWSSVQDIDSETAEEDEFYEQEPLPVLGRCKAIYTFEGECLGSFHYSPVV